MNLSQKWLTAERKDRVNDDKLLINITMNWGIGILGSSRDFLHFHSFILFQNEKSWNHNSQWRIKQSKFSVWSECEFLWIILFLLSFEFLFNLILLIICFLQVRRRPAAVEIYMRWFDHFFFRNYRAIIFNAVTQ